MRSPRRCGRGAPRVSRERVPAWRGYYLDLVALALSGLIYWLTIRTGFSAVISPDSNPTLSLSVYMFFGPALLWIGATLLLVRLRGRFMSAWLARARAAGPGRLGSLVVSSSRAAGLGGQPRPGRDRPAAGLRRQPRRLHGDLRPAGEGRRPAHPRRRRHRQLAPGGGRVERTSRQGGLGAWGGGDDPREPLIRVRGPRPPGHLRHRPEPLPRCDQPA